MENGFILSVLYNGKIHELYTKMIRLGLSYEFHVHVEERTIIFTSGEDGTYHVLDTIKDAQEADKPFTYAIAQKLSSLLIE